MPKSGTNGQRGLVAFEQLQPVLELRDAQREIVDFGFLRDSKPPDDAVDNILATRAEPLALVTPGRQCVAHCRSHRIAIDADTPRQIVGEAVSSLNRQSRPAERCEQRLLQRASRRDTAVLCTLSHR